MSAIAGEGQATKSSARPDPRRSRRARARIADRVMTGVFWGAAIAVGLLLLYIIIYMLGKGLGVISWDFITKYDASGNYVGAQVFNSFYMVVLALLICIPIAFSAAIYLVEYARQGIFTTILRFAADTLAGIPSIILGLFGFLVFVTVLGSGRFLGYSRLAGALTLVMLNLPLLLRVSEDALRAVPNELREASMSLGANKFKTIWRVMLPTALPALTTGVILTAGKMIGETAALIFTAGSSAPVNGWFSLDPLDPLYPGQTLTILLFNLQAEGGGPNAVQIQNGVATLLILFLLVFNLGLRYLAGALSKRLSGRA
jgi:phosphate transport system permease protein